MNSRVWSVASGADGDTGDANVLLLHGSLDRSAGMLKLSRRLDGRCRVVRYDRRGYGRSLRLGGPFDMRQQVADALTVMSSIDPPDRWVLVGHSYGGNVALAVADRHPELVEAVATYESPMSWTEWWPVDTAGGNAMEWRDDPEEAAERFMRRLIGDRRWDRLPPATRSARRAEGAAMIGELVDLRDQAPWSAGRVTAPVLAMYGEHAKSHQRRAMHELGNDLPDARVEMIEGARHFGPNTHPDVVAELVLDLIDRSRSSVE